jgi:hypothetical protein
MDSPTDATLVRYLLGDLPPGEVERLDERSVVDADFSDRLRSIEHDLADAYARGELSAEDRRRWERTFGASASGRGQLNVANALAAREQRADSKRPAFGRKPRRITGSSMLGLAAAAVLALAVAIGYSVHWNGDGSTSVATTVPPATPPAPTANPPSAPPQRSLVAITLPIPLRSAAQPPTLAIAPRTDDVKVELRLAPDNATAYTVDVRDLSSRRIVWSGTDLVGVQRDGDRVLMCTVPADVLPAGRVAFELRASAPRRSEVLGSYPLLIER